MCKEEEIDVLTDTQPRAPVLSNILQTDMLI